MPGVPKATAEAATLASMYPGVPTGFIPEGPFGFGFAVVLILLGVYAALFAKKIESLT